MGTYRVKNLGPEQPLELAIQADTPEGAARAILGIDVVRSGNKGAPWWQRSVARSMGGFQWCDFTLALTRAPASRLEVLLGVTIFLHRTVSAPTRARPAKVGALGPERSSDRWSNPPCPRLEEWIGLSFRPADHGL